MYIEAQTERHCFCGKDKIGYQGRNYCMRTYVTVEQDKYTDSQTAVRCKAGLTDRLEMDKGSVLSMYLLATVIDWLADEVKKESPWSMNTVICDHGNSIQG
ncbi:hypothetical protein XENORESO_003690 [Xenotaenia resolanae]|uniref:Uncharacterized protein n=1 Tax=Xenotaenia resolanae TaxID=208358 RepID=A0ABV0WWB8_9TELE